ncbi:MAG: DNA N-6-adenine-methyltransferase, partial [Promethearchaeota archaeon]
NKWKTPEWLLNHFKNHFDPCPLNPKKDGLKIDWESPAFVNPPYSEPKKWVKKAVKEKKKGVNICMLLKCDPSTSWYKLLIENKARFCYINNRLKFKNIESGKNDSAYFPSMLVFLDGDSNE